MALDGQDTFNRTHSTTSPLGRKHIHFLAFDVSCLPAREQCINQVICFQASSIPYLSLPKKVVVVSSKRGGGARLDQHRKGTGARLTQVVREAGISWVVARTWRGGRRLERKLKGYHTGGRLCPICQGKITIEEVLAAQLPPNERVVGGRGPMGDARPMPAPALDCAWCLTEQGSAPGNDSHGICTRHAEEQYARYKAARTLAGNTKSGNE